MAFELYDLVTVDAVFRQQTNPTPPFWLNFFNRQINFDTPEIYFDKVRGDDRGLAPFVIPTMQGRPQKLDGYTALALRPAYVKILDVVDPSMHVSRVPGESFGGTLTLAQRRAAVIAELLRMAKVKFANRNEWLAARAVIDGKVTISGEDYPSTLVDFRRDSTLTGTLTGTAKWDQSGTANPLGDLKTMKNNVSGLSGVRVRKFIFGSNAWDLFTQRVDLKSMMNIQYGGTETRVTLINEGDRGQEFMGRISGLDGAGAMDLWVDSSNYIDPEDGATKLFLDTNTVVGVNEEVQGVRCFGAIQDHSAGFRPLDYFFKNYFENNPSLEYLLSQSAPLMVPKNPNATFSLKVA